MPRLVTTLRSIVPAVVLALVLLGCSTYRSQLHRGQRYYEENQYEAALALWRDLEPDQDSLTPQERVRYAYFRGMTDYRLGYRSDARYWLSLAQAGEQLRPASLEEDQKQRLEDTLGELNQDVATRIAAETIEPTPPGAPRGPGGSSPGQTPGTTDEGGDPAGTSCEWSTECPRGYICQDQVCVEL